MAKFRKKPIVVEAVQWFRNGDHPEDGVEIIGDMYGSSVKREGKVVRYFRHSDIDGETTCDACGKQYRDHGWIDTLEGGHRVCPGDWIITGVAGERYPCKPDVFAMVYDPVDDVSTGDRDKRD